MCEGRHSLRKKFQTLFRMHDRTAWLEQDSRERIRWLGRKNTARQEPESIADRGVSQDPKINIYQSLSTGRLFTVLDSKFTELLEVLSLQKMGVPNTKTVAVFRNFCYCLLFVSL